MWRNTQTELVKIFAKPRSYIGFVAIAIIVSLIHVAMYVDGLNYISFINYDQINWIFSIYHFLQSTRNCVIFNKNKLCK